MVTLGTWALTIGREAWSGFCLGAVAAIRATPLIFLPYLLLKRRYLACAMFVPFLVAFSVLPDVISALAGGHGGYMKAWVRQTAGPAMATGPLVESSLLGRLDRHRHQQSIAARSG